MSPISLIAKYYTIGTPLYNILLTHSSHVADMAVEIVEAYPQYGADRDLVYQAAMLHDIGIYLTNAPRIFCNGTEPYIRHALLGGDILRREGLPLHALICERHTGAGISAAEIISQNLPLPHKDMIPETIEEKIVAFADKFFSKTELNKKKSLKEARASLYLFGEASLARFDKWTDSFIP
ncbi:MAG: HD domain-containing protein [Bacteroidales bacterium]